jgi:hypothetical protein
MRRHALVAEVLVPSNGVSTLILTQVLQQGCDSKPRHHWAQSATNSLFGLQGIRNGRLVHLVASSCDGMAVRRQE